MFANSNNIQATIKLENCSTLFRSVYRRKTCRLYSIGSEEIFIILLYYSFSIIII